MIDTDDMVDIGDYTHDAAGPGCCAICADLVEVGQPAVNVIGNGYLDDEERLGVCATFGAVWFK